MTIYVDNVGIPADVHNPATGRVVSSHWSHLISDQLDPTELHEFATEKLGLRKSYFQPGWTLGSQKNPDPPGDHYDLTSGKRKQALSKGAVAITPEELTAIMRLKRAVHRLADENCSYALTRHKEDWLVALEWGQEAEDSPMVGAAAYGIGTSMLEAVDMALQEVGSEL